MSYVIKCWTGRILFDGRQFESFEDGWDFLYTELAAEADEYMAETGYEDFYSDFYVEPLVDREGV